MRPYSIKLRNWTLKDAPFIIKLRNDPALMQWFRQSRPITLAQQIKFMESDEGWHYNGKIILLDGKRIGVGAVTTYGELCLALPDKYKLLRRDIIKLLCSPYQMVWGEVLAGNPITWDLEMVGFTPVHTKYVYKRLD